MNHRRGWRNLFNKENGNNGSGGQRCFFFIMRLIFVCHEESTNYSKMPIFAAASIKPEFSEGSRKFWAALNELRNHHSNATLFRNFYFVFCLRKWEFTRKWLGCLSETLTVRIDRLISGRTLGKRVGIFNGILGLNGFT